MSVVTAGPFALQFHPTDSVASTEPPSRTPVLGLDLFISYWGPILYAHTILSWEFQGSPPLAAFIETRKEKGESYRPCSASFGSTSSSTSWPTRAT